MRLREGDSLAQLAKEPKGNTMTNQLAIMLQSLIGLSTGALIGAGFGLIQDAARRRNEKKQAEGKLTNGWAVMPGSGSRVAYLLVALVLIQFICPLLFKDGTQWWVSGGLVAGYGFILFRELRHRMAQNK